MKQLIIARNLPSPGHCQGAGGSPRPRLLRERRLRVVLGIGHLLELAVPEEYDVKRGKWEFYPPADDPATFRAEPDRENAGTAALLTRLIKRKDVTGLVNACDAGREGELIFRYVAQHALGAKQKPTAACGCNR